MKKYISYLLASALLAPVFVSCNERLQEEEIPVRTHKVFFSATQAETRTGLSIEGNVVTPDWNKTQVENIHLFETDANNATVYGETLNIIVGDDKEAAQFEADFPEEMTIAVGTGQTAATGGSVSRVAPFNYTAVIAQKAAGETLAFVIPAEQHPDAETLKDPDADFLVGYGADAVDAPHNYDEPVVDLYFDRAAAMGQVAISNFSATTEKVQSVTINTTAGLTGSAAFSDIDFEKATVAFTRAEGPLSLVYDNGADVPADGPFYAYFVAIPGEATISSIEVVTDQYRYTKEVGKATTLSADSFKNFTLDLSTATREGAGPDLKTWYQASVLEDGSDYLIVSQNNALKNNEGATASVSLTATDGVITLEAEDPTLVWRATAHEEMTGDNGEGGIVAGHFTLTNNGYYLQRKSNTDILLGATIPSDKPKYVVWDYDGSYLHHESSETATFFCYYNDGWSTGYTSNGAAPGSSIKTVQIYTNRQPQAFEFTSKTVEYDFDAGGEFQEPGFTKAPVGELTYSSSNETVATVVPATGEVTILSAGTADITVVASGNSIYQAGTASYTIHSNTSKVQKWVKAEDIEDGEKYLIVSNGEALQNNSGSAAAVAVVEDSGVIMYNATDDMIWTAAATSSSGKFTFQNNGQYMQRGGSSNNYVPTFSSSTSSYYQWSYNYSSSYLTASGNSTYYVYYSTGNSKWSMSTSDGNTHQTALYKLDDGRVPQEIAFTSDTAEYDLYIDGGKWTKAVPTLNGAQGTVTYESSNTSVATVDASSGTVTIAETAKAGNTAVITAKATGNDSYKPGEASYTITIKNSDPNVPTYTKVTSTAGLEAGAQYLLVFEGLPSNSEAGNQKPKVYNPTLNDGGTQFNKVKADAVDVTITDYTITSADYGDCHFTLEDGYYLKSDKVGKYIVPTAPSSGSGTITAESTASTKLEITFDGGIAKIKATNYLVWSTSSNYFSSNSSVSGEYSTGICLYKLEDSRTPQTFEFAQSTVEYDFDAGGDFQEPAFTTTPVGTVTYSSDNEDVASVNASTGAVTVNQAGTAVITARAAGNNTYRPHSASYTIHSNTSKIQKWIKADAITTGKSYLVVSEGYALQNNSGSVSAVQVTVGSNGKIEFNAPASIVWTASSEQELVNNNQNLMRAGSDSSRTVAIGTTDTDRDKQWTYSASDNTMKVGSWYLYYSSGFKLGYVSSGSVSYHSTLYTLESAE